jgi:hypothetical protein
MAQHRMIYILTSSHVSKYTTLKSSENQLLCLLITLLEDYQIYIDIRIHVCVYMYIYLCILFYKELFLELVCMCVCVSIMDTPIVVWQ